MSIFKKKQAIEELQAAVMEQSNALLSEDKALTLMFKSQKQLASVSSGLLVLGMANMASNRVAYETLKTELEKASTQELNARLLAKMASDFEKPDKVHTLWESEVREKMWPLPVRDLLWVGRKTEERLTAYGIKTIGQLAQLGMGSLPRGEGDCRGQKDACRCLGRRHTHTPDGPRGVEAHP